MTKLHMKTEVNVNLRPGELLQERVTRKSLKSFFIDKKFDRYATNVRPRAFGLDLLQGSRSKHLRRRGDINS